MLLFLLLLEVGGPLLLHIFFHPCIAQPHCGARLKRVQNSPPHLAHFTGRCQLFLIGSGRGVGFGYAVAAAERKELRNRS